MSSTYGKVWDPWRVLFISVSVIQGVYIPRLNFDEVFVLC
jgi:hypothetical protein